MVAQQALPPHAGSTTAALIVFCSRHDRALEVGHGPSTWGPVRSTSAAAGSIRRTAIRGERSPKRKAAPSTGLRLRGRDLRFRSVFPSPSNAAFCDTLAAFHRRLASVAEREADRAAATLLDPDGRWNGLINAVSTYVSGAELDRVSVRDLRPLRRQRHQLAHCRGLWRGDCCSCRQLAGDARLQGPTASTTAAGASECETSNGVITADAIIVTLPTTVLAGKRVSLQAGLTRQDRGGGGPAVGAGRQAVHVNR